MGLFKTLFSSDTLVEKASDGIDAAFYTKEEKARHFLSLLKLYEPYKVAQRFLMLIFSIPYALAWVVTYGASFKMDVAKQYALLNDPNGIQPIVLMIAIFYFGGGALEGVVSRFRDNKKTEK